MAAQTAPLVSRRDRQRQETRRDLAFAALELADTHGLANVRVPDIAAAAGVSPRTFNNYFDSKEAAIAWPARQRGIRLAEDLGARPPEERLHEAIVGAVSERYARWDDGGFPGPWLQKFRVLVAREPALFGEYLKAADATERALAEAIRVRMGATEDELRPKLLAAVAVAVERTAVRHWMTQQEKAAPLGETVRTALEQALPEIQT